MLQEAPINTSLVRATLPRLLSSLEGLNSFPVQQETDSAPPHILPSSMLLIRSSRQLSHCLRPCILFFFFFFIAAAANDHKLNGAKQHRFILCSWRLEI